MYPFLCNYVAEFDAERRNRTRHRQHERVGYVCTQASGREWDGWEDRGCVAGIGRGTVVDSCVENLAGNVLGQLSISLAECC
jgi:hypothetical protein